MNSKLKPFDIIVAVDQKNGIGKNGGLPWSLSEDMQHFKKVTTQTQDSLKKNAVVMGRKTWESIPDKFRPLPDRVNVVLTRNSEFLLPEGVIRADSLESACNQLKDDRIEKIFVVGGASIYAQALESEMCESIYLTRIFKDFECDTFFPSIEIQFKEIESSEEKSQDDLTYCFSSYKNNKFL